MYHGQKRHTSHKFTLKCARGVGLRLRSEALITRTRSQGHWSGEHMRNATKQSSFVVGGTTSV